MAVIPRLIGISPGDHGCGRTLSWLIQGAVNGGLKAVILREPHLSRAAYVELARRLSPLFGTGLLLHASHDDALEIAERSGWGIHLPGSIEWVGIRPRVSGLLGMSCHTVDDLKRAEDAGADYATYSPVFGPLSKPSDRRPILGPEGIDDAVAQIAIPIIAVGGITADTARQVGHTHCHGIGSMGHLFPGDADADLTQERASSLLAAFSEVR